ncbi:hypothetical protein HanPI659440_Chr10g0369361 [Helianthus annuus]|nr:hypothetical protein HanPI659440_Chr10g0369361 [Helianthus annuus]
MIVFVFVSDTIKKLGVVCLPLNEALNGSDLLLVQHLMVQTVCFTSKCLNGSDICL